MKGQGPRSRQPAVGELLFQLKAARIGKPLVAVATEVKFHITRKWRLDVTLTHVDWRIQPLAVEVDGGGFIPGGGRHSRGVGIEKDCEKYAEAMKLGWRVLRVTPKHIKSGQALAWIQELLK